MPEEADNRLLDLLQLRESTTDILRNRESSKLELKQSLNFSQQASYARTMAAFANNRGGYIVFGVKDRPHEIVGVEPRTIDRFDPARLTTFLSSHVAPLFDWVFGSIEFAGTTLAYIYTEPCLDGPVMVTSNHNKVLKEGEIYFRYTGQTRAIKYAELTTILDQRLERERRAWMSHLERISRAGPSNVGILDTARGEMYGGDTTFLIDEQLTDKLKFIRKGHFDRTDGEPTLRLVGDLHQVSSVVAPVQVPTGIHMTDLIEAAVSDEDLPTPTARSYLRETVDQNSPMAPVFRFVKVAGLDRQGAVDWVMEAPTGFTATRKRVIERLRGIEKIAPLGKPPTDLPMKVPTTSEDLATAVESERVPVEQRALLIASLHKAPSTVVGAVDRLPVNRVCEALMHVDRDVLEQDREQMWSVVRAILEGRFDDMESSERTIFRRAVAYLDQELFPMP